MNKQASNLHTVRDKESLKKYAEAYNLKKGKSKTEKQLEETNKYYVIYARKSTEGSERQIQSIDDQIDHCKKYADDNGFEVVEVIREEKSAKTAGRRPEFQKMLDTLQEGNSYNSILAWHPDRLSRNMKESGEILDMLDNDIILDLKFPSYTFNNDTAGKMTLSILFAMAKEFSDKLSDDTKRGIHKTIKEGKHCGSDKRGYYRSRNSYYREDKDSYEIYKQAWDDYIEGKSQQEILKSLKDKGERISKNSLSNMFQDPFYAGFYCYGDLVVDMAVDPKFKPMVSPSAFLTLQRRNRGNPRGWRNTSDFRPFSDLITCGNCNNFMTPGVSTGKGGRYFSITCGNSKCKEERRNKNIKPISNTVRGEVILDFVCDTIKNDLKIDKKTYKKVKDKFLEEKNTVVKDNKEQIRILNIKLSKLEDKKKKMTDRILNEKESDVAADFSKQCSIIINQIRDLKQDIREYEVENSQYEAQADIDFPDYDTFMNFFENIVTAIQETKDVYLIDQLVKLVFLNIIASDKKVLAYSLNEPFGTYSKLKFLSGVDEGA
jgi:site-specific DNA recombinase